MKPFMTLTVFFAVAFAFLGLISALLAYIPWAMNPDVALWEKFAVTALACLFAAVFFAMGTLDE